MPITPGLIAGIVALSIDGVAFVVRGQCTYRCNTVRRTSVEAQSGTPGYKEMPVYGRIAAKLSDAGDLSLALINGMRNVTVAAQLANGKMVTGAGMWSVDDQEVDTEEGQFDCAFEGPLVEEVPL